MPCYHPIDAPSYAIIETPWSYERATKAEQLCLQYSIHNHISSVGRVIQERIHFFGLNLRQKVRIFASAVGRSKQERDLEKGNCTSKKQPSSTIGLPRQKHAPAAQIVPGA
jgi:hypothetical protein